MGLQLPGSNFVNPYTELRELLNEEIVKVISQTSKNKSFDKTLYNIVNEKTIVNTLLDYLQLRFYKSHNHLMRTLEVLSLIGMIFQNYLKLFPY